MTVTGAYALPASNSSISTIFYSVRGIHAFYEPFPWAFHIRFFTHFPAGGCFAFGSSSPHTPAKLYF